ncbi:MAG: CDP-alcohol phosphatidyltransferase family protein, partial [Clostridia bacterium]|nr:CDP-alcohol phosphatidyltransferase family protein [Clostridia bacterium]
MNTPNKLTVARVIITPLFMLAFLSSLPHRFIISAAIFAIASITDAVDGKLARKNNQVTTFGKFLDPVADKMLTTAALLAFIQEG